MTDETQRLFVAVPVPAGFAECFRDWEPPSGEAVRLVEPSDLHITLHFLGSMAAPAVTEALGNVAANGFNLRLRGTHHFDLRDRRRILYVGVEPAEPLFALHTAVAGVLLPLGFEPEPRRYVPHVTIARLGAGASRAVVESFERREVPESWQTMTCDRFALYTTDRAAQGGRYRVMASYPLRQAGRRRPP